MIIRIMMTDSATVSALQKMIPRKSLTLLECQFTCFACTAEASAANFLFRCLRKI